MILALFLALVPQRGLQAAIEHAAKGDFASAWTSAVSATDALEAAQARVYVRQHAGDLEGALLEATRGSDANPRDPWLAERVLALAVSLSRLHPAEVALARLETALQAEHVKDREAFLTAARSAHPAVESLANVARSRDAAETRARIVVIGVGAVALFALVWLARKS